MVLRTHRFRLDAAAALLALLPLAAGCAATAPPPRGPAAPRVQAGVQAGVASFYARRFHGRRTASGERYDETRLTAAHRRLPFGTRVRVTRLDNRRHVVVRINDRGPHVRGRLIDLSLAAARELGMVGRGLARVRLEVL